MELDLGFCAKCGERLGTCDSRNNIFDFRFGYGSKRDGKEIKFTLCSNCLDDVFDFIFEVPWQE